MHKKRSVLKFAFLNFETQGKRTQGKRIGVRVSWLRVWDFKGSGRREGGKGWGEFESFRALGVGFSIQRSGCVCVCERACVCVCQCVCVRAKESERARESEKER